ncbi:TetR/AcrR family transcriptional regulator [Kribbella sp. NBC_00359]|uniref:TetR/AcrR family transcriptional regulator n=1 Tax=Kribbella sp. NBC_00359 TaxID=2975966 RepID=UPI002E24BBB7
MTKQVPLGADRRDAIADAAIHLVATRGLRGLTHRAVDAEAGLPPGSTSYYLRTRNALLTACVNRMLARDMTAAAPTGAQAPSDVEAPGREAPDAVEGRGRGAPGAVEGQGRETPGAVEGRGRGGPGGVEVPSGLGVPPVELLVGMTVGLARDRPDDLVARYELSLEASRQPELRAAIDEGGRQLRALLAQSLDGLGVPNPSEAAWPVAAMMDGLLYDRVAGAGATLSPEAFEAGVRRSVTALIEGLRSGR